MYRQFQLKQKLDVKDPRAYYINKLLRKRHVHVGTSIKDNTVIKCCVIYDRFSNRMIVKVVKYHIGGNFIIIYSYNQPYKTVKELKERFFSIWEKPDHTIDTRKY